MLRWVRDAAEPWQSCQLDTPAGALTVVYGRRHIVVAAHFLDGPPPAHWFQRPVAPTSPPDWVQELTDAALSGTLKPSWHLLDPGLSPLMAQVLHACERVPFGSLTSYGRLAAAAGHPGRARLAGFALSRSPASLLIPTHRVVRADGRPAPSERGGAADALRRHERERTAFQSPDPLATLTNPVPTPSSRC